MYCTQWPSIHLRSYTKCPDKKSKSGESSPKISHRTEFVIMVKIFFPLIFPYYNILHSTHNVPLMVEWLSSITISVSKKNGQVWTKQHHSSHHFIEGNYLLFIGFEMLVWLNSRFLERGPQYSSALCKYLKWGFVCFHWGKET